MVESNRIAAAIVDRGFGIVGIRDVVNDLRDARFGKCADLRVQRAHRAGQQCFFRNDIVGRSGLELGDRDNDGMQWIGVARSDQLEAGTPPARQW